MGGFRGSTSRDEGDGFPQGRRDDWRRKRQEKPDGREISYSSRSTASGRRAIRLKFCECGVETHLMTSKTGENRGRRFYGCGLYEVHGRKECDFFEWYDDSGSERQKAVIAGLTRKIQELKKQMQFVMCCLVIAIMVIMVLAVAYVMK
ncbi:hypothetical protein OROGR_028954 [Orobanche gracilis]